MPIKYHHTMQSGGEVFTVELVQTNPQTGAPEHTLEEMDAMMDQALLVMDKRKFEMNMRVLEAYGLINFLTQTEQVKFKALLHVLSGNITPAYLKEQWEAAREETAELEALRESYVQKQREEAMAILDSMEAEPTVLCDDCQGVNGNHKNWCSKVQNVYSPSE